MLYVYFISIVVFLYVISDLNYLFRTFFTVWCERLYQGKYTLNDSSIIYGICTFQDCDIRFQGIRLARLVRELDFARYHYYDRTGIYQNSRQRGIKSLRGSTLTIYADQIPLFKFYKITTKLVYWDERSLFFEHIIVTVYDNRVRYLLVSRQYAIGKYGASTAALLQGLPGSEREQAPPKYIKSWLQSMAISSERLRKEQRDVT